ncbi:hypothetical protein [Moraxella oculi]|uniref:Uncharacterized protein n=1 Tax=Moraxella oculi TaxID=2940516 RepID=A0ABW8U7K8_9GAMM
MSYSFLSDYCAIKIHSKAFKHIRRPTVTPSTVLLHHARLSLRFQINSNHR